MQTGKLRGLVASLALGASCLTTHSAMAREPGAKAELPIIELRQYRVVPGKRDTFLALFERELLEPQDALGIPILGQFRDMDRPNHIVWIRGFTDMPARGKALNDFYYGPVWQAHRAEANPLLEDNDNVLMLRESRPGASFKAPKPRPPRGTTALPGGFVAATIYYLNEMPDAAFVDFFDKQVKPALAKAKLPVLASFVPETAANNFPRLPVREGEKVFVWFTRADSPADYDRAIAAVEASKPWRGAVAPALKARLAREPEILRLEPAARSPLR